MFEIALTRVFSVMLAYHYVFIAVSVALLGLGIGAVFFRFIRARMPAERSFSALCKLSLIFALSIPIAGDMTIPLILSGPGIQPGELKDAEIIDVAPTVSALFGLRAPKDTEGRNLFAQPAGPSMIYIAIGAGIILTVMLIIFIVRKISREKTSEKAGSMTWNVNLRN